MIRIAIVDDQDMVRESLRILLQAQADFDVVGIGKDGYEALKLVTTLQPDVLLLDIRMPVMDGVAATETLKLKSPNTAIIILTTFNDDEYVLRAIKNGASGYLLKSAGLDELAQAIRTVHNGGSLMSPDVATKAFRLFSALAKNEEQNRVPAAHAPSPPHKNNANPQDPEPFRKPGLPTNLTKTELQIMSLIGQGWANKEVASKLGLSEGTVRNYISSILLKTELRDRTQIAIYAVRHGLAEFYES